jgi:hypothetical protein
MYAVALGSQECGSFRIMAKLMGFTVRGSIDFNDEFLAVTEKVDDIGWNWKLPLKFKTIEAAVAQMKP